MAELLRDEAARVRFLSAVVLCRVRVIDALPALHALIAGEEDWHLRSVAVEAVGRQGGARALEILQTALQQETETEALPSYAVALGATGEAAAITDLLRMADGDDWRVRYGAARGLAHLRHPTAVSLADSLAADPEVPEEHRPEMLRWRTNLRRKIRPEPDEGNQQ
ncbi:MAG: HEAT repeat domain-containing protein [Armatimonadetes bacterium]|nr:HEAT repeat domain-containing protein [Armatimonadota bacterium]